MSRPRTTPTSSSPVASTSRVAALSAAACVSLSPVLAAPSHAAVKPVVGANAVIPTHASVSATTHTVRPGETLRGLASRYGVSTAALANANDLDNPHFIRSGSELTIPAATHATTTKTTPDQAEPGPGDSTDKSASDHTVARGDTLGGIALAHKTTVSALLRANPELSRESTLRPGQVLQLPGDAHASASSSSTADAHKRSANGATENSSGTTSNATYRVVRGDTLGGIAARHKTTVRALRSANPELGSSHLITIGQRLVVPAQTKAVSQRTVGSTFAGRTYAPETVSQAQADLDTLNSRSAPSREQMKALIREQAQAYGVDPALALAISYQESGFNMQRVSPAGAIGAMQVIPSSGRWASQLIGRDLDLLDPRDNATAGVVILRANLNSADTVDQAIGGYYQGLASIRSRGMYADTRRYVANVRTLSSRFA